MAATRASVNWSLTCMLCCSPLPMSRIPQASSSSRNTPRSPTKTPLTPTSRIGASSTSRPRPAPSPTPGSRTLRPQKSLQVLKPASSQKSPAKRPKPLPDVQPSSPKAPTLSIREQIALRRAEAKKVQDKGTAKTGLDDFDGLEDALPNRDPSPDIIDLGRWSVKETIERGRSTGEFLLVLPLRSVQSSLAG